jgi:hypothetical protein
MKVIIDFYEDADIIECPENIVGSLMDYREKFLEWLFDKQNEHSYWYYKNGEKFGCCYRSEAFVEWLNKFILFDSLDKVEVIETNVTELDKSLPFVSF